MRFLKNNWLLALVLFSVAVLALILRLIGIDKPTGLWYDEVNTYNAAALSDLYRVILKSLPRPFYYVVLHYWIVLFGDADVTLRLLSVVFGVINVPVTYFAGLELEKYFNKDNFKKISSIGLAAAVFVAVNAFLIYYSQEVRQYSLLALISTMSAWFTLRVINKPCKLNYYLFFGTNAVFLITHFISTLLIIPEIAVICVYLFLNNREKFRPFLKNLAVFMIPCIAVFALLINVFIHLIVHPDNQIISDYSGVFPFDSQVIFAYLQNYFSPVLVGIYNNIVNYFPKMLSNITSGKIIFIFAPVIISLWFIIKAVLKDKSRFNPVYVLLLPPVCFLVIVFILSFLETYIIISRYTLICLPFFVLILARGVDCFKNKLIPYAAFSFLILASLFYLVFYPNSAPKLGRPDGQKMVADLFTEISLKETDTIIFPRNPGTIDKYYKNKFKKYAINREFMTKQTVYLLVGKETATKISTANSRELLKDYLLSEAYTPEFENYVKNHFFDPLPESGYFILVHNKDISYYTPEIMEKILANQELYEKNPLRFMMYSKITLDLFGASQKYMELKQVRQKPPWTIFIFQK